MNGRGVGVQPDHVGAASRSDAEVLSLTDGEAKEPFVASDDAARVVDDGSGTGSLSGARRDELVVASRRDETELLALPLGRTREAERDRFLSRLDLRRVAQWKDEPRKASGVQAVEEVALVLRL